MTPRWRKDIDCECYSIKLGVFTLCVHRHVSFPDNMWLTSCGYIFSCRKLESKDLKDAKGEAVDMLKEILNEALYEARKV